jgi:hypothetical protein
MDLFNLIIGVVYESYKNKSNSNKCTWESDYGDGFFRIAIDIYGDFSIICRFGGNHSNIRDKTTLIFKYQNNTRFLNEEIIELKKHSIDVNPEYDSSLDIDLFNIHIMFEKSTNIGNSKLNNQIIKYYINNTMDSFEVGLDEISKFHSVLPDSHLSSNLINKGYKSDYTNISLQFANNSNDLAIDYINKMKLRINELENILKVKSINAISTDKNISLSVANTKTIQSIDSKTITTSYNSSSNINKICGICNEDNLLKKEQLIACINCKNSFHTVCFGAKRIPFSMKTPKEMRNREKYLAKYYGNWICSNCKSQNEESKQQINISNESNSNSISTIKKITSSNENSTLNSNQGDSSRIIGNITQEDSSNKIISSSPSIKVNSNSQLIQNENNSQIIDNKTVSSSNDSGEIILTRVDALEVNSNSNSQTNSIISAGQFGSSSFNKIFSDGDEVTNSPAAVASIYSSGAAPESESLAFDINSSNILNTNISNLNIENFPRTGTDEVFNGVSSDQILDITNSNQIQINNNQEIIARINQVEISKQLSSNIIQVRNNNINEDNNQINSNDNQIDNNQISRLNDIILIEKDINLDEKMEIKVPETKLEMVKLSNHPVYCKYFKMLKVGLPIDVLKVKMIQEGIDANYLDKDPNELIILNDDNVEDKEIRQIKKDIDKKIEKNEENEEIILKEKIEIQNDSTKLINNSKEIVTVTSIEKKIEKKDEYIEIKKEEMVKVSDHPVYSKYFKMRKVGLPNDIVKAKMTQERLDVSYLDKDPNEFIPLIEKKIEKKNEDKEIKKEEIKEEEMVKVSEHPVYIKYFKMIKVGIPPDTVKGKMGLEGLDGSYLDKDPNELIPLKDEKIEKKIEMVKVSEHPEYIKYFKMIKVGLPLTIVKAKMAQEGLDGSYLDKDPNELIPLKDEKEEKKENSISKPNKSPIKKESIRKKKLHWKALDTSKVSSNSLWHNNDDDDDINLDDIIDEKEFQNLFRESVNNTDTKSISNNVTKKVIKNISLIDMKRSQNAGIALSHIKLSNDDIKKHILEMNEEIFTTDQLNNLNEYLPNIEERNLLNKFTKDKNNDVNNLNKPEKYMIKMINLLSASKRIQCMIFKKQFSIDILEIKSTISKLEKACDDVKMSIKLKKVLKTILTVGNKMNEGNY